MSEILWRPSSARAETTLLRRFAERAPGAPDDYHDLWAWSVAEPAAFWAQVWRDCGVVASRDYDEVMGEPRMPGTRWFAGAELNVADNLLRRRHDGVVLVGAGEGRATERVSGAQLYARVARAQQGLRELGLEPGDRVAALLPNCVETVVLALATAASGGVWSSCSPDFGPMGVVDRFGQIGPKLLLACDGYRYNGTVHAVGDTVRAALDAMPTVEQVVTVDFAGVGLDLPGRTHRAYDDVLANDADSVDALALPAQHPLAILYTSGTTGAPKSIVHGAAGTLVKHLTEHQLHADVRPGDVVFWFTTCGWMMWNWLLSALASEAAIVCYDGSPAYPGLETLWELAERAGITHFGTSPRFLAACADAGLSPSRVADLSRVRMLGSTGAPLQPEQFDWVYGNVGADLQLASVSGGTDIVGCFAGGVPTLPVRRGELQARSLGMAVETWNERGEPVIGEKGELVCTAPFPSMPLGFWDDPDGARYRAAYFAQHPGVWTHGDFIEIRPHGGVVIYGRSDTTLNPGGVRIGTAEIYRAVEGLDEVVDSLAVGRPHDGDVEVVLCVQLAAGVSLDDALRARIADTIRAHTSPRHVPRRTVAVSAIPYTRNGKKVEKAVGALLAGEPVTHRDALADPEVLDEYASLELD